MKYIKPKNIIIKFLLFIHVDSCVFCHMLHVRVKRFPFNSVEYVYASVKVRVYKTKTRFFCSIDYSYLIAYTCFLEVVSCFMFA